MVDGPLRGRNGGENEVALSSPPSSTMEPCHQTPATCSLCTGWFLPLVPRLNSQIIGLRSFQGYWWGLQTWGFDLINIHLMIMSWEGLYQPWYYLCSTIFSVLFTRSVWRIWRSHKYPWTFRWPWLHGAAPVRLHPSSVHNREILEILH